MDSPHDANLLATLQPRIDRHLNRLGLLPADVEDVRQAVLEQFIIGGGEIEKPRAWIRTVTSRLGMLHQQREMRREQREQEHEALKSGTWAPTFDQACDVKRALATAPAPVTMFLTARYVEEQSLNELTETFDTSRATVKRRINLAREMLLRRLER